MARVNNGGGNEASTRMDSERCNSPRWSDESWVPMLAFFKRGAKLRAFCRADTHRGLAAKQLALSVACRQCSRRRRSVVNARSARGLIKLRNFDHASFSLQRAAPPNKLQYSTMPCALSPVRLYPYVAWRPRTHSSRCSPHDEALQLTSVTQRPYLITARLP